VTCRTELENQQQLVTTLEQMPHFTPSPLFAYRVMRKVEVFEPWYVTALNHIRRFVPRSRPARVFAATLGVVVAMALTAAGVWMASRLDAVAFLAGVALERTRGVGTQVVNGFVSSALGSSPVSGESGLALTIAGFIAAVAVSAFGLRAIAAASRRRRM
jgi:hypothetical protein